MRGSECARANQGVDEDSETCGRADAHRGVGDGEDAILHGALPALPHLTEAGGRKNKHIRALLLHSLFLYHPLSPSIIISLSLPLSHFPSLGWQ